MKLAVTRRLNRCCVFGADQDDPGVLVGKFENALPTSTARRARLDVIAASNRRNCNDAFAARSNHRPDGVGFRTGSFGVGCVFDIAAGMDIAVLVENSGVIEAAKGKMLTAYADRFKRE